MKSIIKKVFIILVFLCLTPLAFAEQYYGFGAGLSFFRDNFPKESYSRGQLSTHFDLSFYYFPEDIPLGLFSQASVGGTSLFMERNARESMMARKNCDIFEFRLAAAPSYRFEIGKKAFFPISLGPSFILTTEKISEREYEGSGFITKKYNYQSMSFGLKADAGFLVVPSDHFYLKPGLAFDGIFFRAENGEMRMNYRTTHNAVYKSVSYYALHYSVYYLMGFHL